MNPQALAAAALELNAEEFQQFLFSLADAMHRSGNEILDQSGDTAMRNAAQFAMRSADAWQARSGN